MPAKKDAKVFIGTRIEKHRVERIDTMRRRMFPKLKPSRSLMLDLIIEKGIEVMEKGEVAR